MEIIGIGLTSVFSLIFGFLFLLVKNPIIQKIALFGFFFSFLTFVVDYSISLVISNLPDIGQVFTVATYLGLMKFISIIITYLITAFFIKHTIGFIRS